MTAPPWRLAPRPRQGMRVVMVLLYVAGLAACDSSSPPTSVTVAPAPSPPSGLPGTAVAAEESGRLVVVDVASGKALRTLMTFSDLRTEAPEGGHAAPRDIALTPDGTIAYLELCCEPAAGDIRRVPTAGGGGAGADSVAHGYAPSVSPDGASVAWGTYTSGITIRTGDQQRLVPGRDDRRTSPTRPPPGSTTAASPTYVRRRAGT